MKKTVRFVMHPDCVDNSYYGINTTKINYRSALDTTIEKTLNETEYPVFVMSSEGLDKRFKKKFPKGKRIIYLNTPLLKKHNSFYLMQCGEMKDNLQYYHDMITEIDPEVIEGGGAFLTMCLRNSILQQYLKLYDNRDWFRNDYEQSKGQGTRSLEQAKLQASIIRGLESKNAFRESKFRLGVVVTEPAFPINQRIHIIHKSDGENPVSPIQRTGNMIYQLTDKEVTRMFGAMNELMPDGTLVHSAWNDRMRYQKECQGKPKGLIPIERDPNEFEIDMVFR